MATRQQEARGSWFDPSAGAKFADAMQHEYMLKFNTYKEVYKIHLAQTRTDYRYWQQLHRGI